MIGVNESVICAHCDNIHQVEKLPLNNNKSLETNQIDLTEIDVKLYIS